MSKAECHRTMLHLHWQIIPISLRANCIIWRTSPPGRLYKQLRYSLPVGHEFDTILLQFGSRNLSASRRNLGRYACRGVGRKYWIHNGVLLPSSDSAAKLDIVRHFLQWDLLAFRHDNFKSAVFALSQFVDNEATTPLPFPIVLFHFPGWAPSEQETFVSVRSCFGCIVGAAV